MTAVELDILKEIGTTGAGHAATGLSTLLGRRIDITVSHARVMDIEDVPGALGGPELLIGAVYVQVVGPVTGSMMLIFPLEETLRLADFLLGREKGKTHRVDESAESALKEMGNISTGSYLTALSRVSGLKLMHSIPGLATDMLQAVLDGILAQTALKADQVVLLDTCFELEQSQLKGHYLFIPDPDELTILLNALAKKKAA